jgi:hypothetical protein
MASRVTLHVRIVRPDGTRTYAAPVYAANRRLCGGYALVNGKPEPHPEACYYLRYPVEGKRVWRNVGADPLAAQNALAVQEHHVGLPGRRGQALRGHAPRRQPQLPGARRGDRTAPKHHGGSRGRGIDLIARRTGTQ